MNSCAQPFRGSEQFNRHSQNRQSSNLQARSYNADPNDLQLLLDQSNLVRLQLPLALSLHPHVHVAILAATFLGSILAVFQSEVADINGHIAMNLQFLACRVDRLQVGGSRLEILHTLRFGHDFAAWVDEDIVGGPNLIERRQVVFHQCIRVFPVTALKSLIWRR